MLKKLSNITLKNIFLLYIINSLFLMSLGKKTRFVCFHHHRLYDQYRPDVLPDSVNTRTAERRKGFLRWNTGSSVEVIKIVQCSYIVQSVQYCISVQSCRLPKNSKIGKPHSDTMTNQRFRSQYVIFRHLSFAGRPAPLIQKRRR